MRLIILNVWNDVVDVELLYLAVDEVPRPSDAPIDKAPVGALQIVVCVPALGHDPVLAYAALAPLELVVQEHFAREASAVLAVVVIRSSRAVRKSSVLAAHLCYLVHLVAAIALALKRTGTSSTR